MDPDFKIVHKQANIVFLLLNLSSCRYRYWFHCTRLRQAVTVLTEQILF